LGTTGNEEREGMELAVSGQLLDGFLGYLLIPFHLVMIYCHPPLGIDFMVILVLTFSLHLGTFSF
jgi:hypothetical protein